MSAPPLPAQELPQRIAPDVSVDLDRVQRPPVVLDPILEPSAKRLGPIRSSGTAYSPILGLASTRLRHFPFPPRCTSRVARPG